MMRHKGMFPVAALAALACAAASGCRPPAPRLRPPAKITSMEGYASLRLSGEQGGVKSRFSFQVLPPGRGRVEVFDVLGRVMFYFVLDDGRGHFVLPREKVYCPILSQEVMARFLGFALDLEEWTALLCGVWPQAAAPGGEALGWALLRDGRNRVVSGRKGDVSFEVTEFFPGGTSPRRLSFGNERAGGSLTVLDLRTNSPLRETSFLLSPPEGYRPRTWEEMERLLRRED